MNAEWEDEIGDFLSNLEPFKQTIYGMPIKSITYSSTEICIKIFTEEGLNGLYLELL